jgi:hypothetical protein
MLLRPRLRSGRASTIKMPGSAFGIVILPSMKPPALRR